MINLSLDELKLIARNRNMRDYEEKSEKDLMKLISKSKPKIQIDKTKLEEVRKDFNELRHKFSKKEIDKYRKAFYDIENYRYLSTSEIEKVILIVLIMMILIIMMMIMILPMMVNREKLEALKDY